MEKEYKETVSQVMVTVKSFYDEILVYDKPREYNFFILTLLAISPKLGNLGTNIIAKIINLGSLMSLSSKVRQLLFFGPLQPTFNIFSKKKCYSLNIVNHQELLEL